MPYPTIPFKGHWVLKGQLWHWWHAHLQYGIPRHARVPQATEGLQVHSWYLIRGLRMCIHKNTYIHTHTYLFVYWFIDLYIYIYTYLCAYMYACTHIYIYTHTYTHTYMYIWIYTSIHICINTYSYTHRMLFGLFGAPGQQDRLWSQVCDSKALNSSLGIKVPLALSSLPAHRSHNWDHRDLQR